MTTKPIANVGGGQRKRFAPALEEAQALGCDIRGATVRFSGSGHPRITVTGPDGRPVSVQISCSPKDESQERNNVRRRLRKALHRNGST